ncbi:MAG: hypothetical protein LBV74_00420 [Tannerella sp.]|jgi:hypothetical protein|nr:hypothetical protein [Tannerella sp.]
MKSTYFDYQYCGMKGKQKKIVLFYYTQTGQALRIAEKVCEPLVQTGYEVVRKEIVPEEPYPFPWSAMGFFQAFPESRLGIPCRLKPIDLSDVEDADLVFIAGQSWYLSWSIPLHSFFQSEDLRKYLKGRDVIVVMGCRNMWVMTQEKTREYLREIGANYVGFISLQDKAPNLVSVITIVRWLFYNKREATRFLPAAGVSPSEVDHAAVYGHIIKDALEQNDYSGIQEKLMDNNAVTFLSTVYFIEKNGYRLWGHWARFIIRKGTYNDPKREPYLRVFCAYLFFVLYAVSPIGMIFFFLTYPLRRASLRRAKQEMCYELN